MLASSVALVTPDWEPVLFCHPAHTFSSNLFVPASYEGQNVSVGCTHAALDFIATKCSRHPYCHSSFAHSLIQYICIWYNTRTPRSDLCQQPQLSGAAFHWRHWWEKPLPDRASLRMEQNRLACPAVTLTCMDRQAHADSSIKFESILWQSVNKFSDLQSARAAQRDTFEGVSA